MQGKRRYAYIDNMKFAACILVALGHLFMSLQANSVLPQSDFLTYLKETLYTFHVPIFFVCSGFLYQKSCRVTSFKGYKKELPRKLLDLGVPYVVFTSATLILKLFFENDVTTKASPFLDTLIMHPTAPYWFLYSLFLMFLLIPCMKTMKGAYILFFASFAIKIIYTAFEGSEIIILPKNAFLLFLFLRVESFCNSAVWFCGGMLLSFLDEEKIKKSAKALSPVLFISAMALSIYIFYTRRQLNITSQFIIGMLFVLFTVISAIAFSPEALNRVSFKFSDYFMPVFIMHTMCAAPLRIILLKLGIASFIPHLIAGLIGSILIPTVIYIICKKLTPLMFFFYPTKTIKLLKRKKNEQN